MEDKYYTPKLEEFHVGFEYEQRCGEFGIVTKDSPWQKKVFYDLGILLSNPRVKKLDREDIESLGFVYYQPDRMFDYFEKGDYCICVYQSDYTRVDITNANSDTIFDGFIKNKSELKRLMEQLGII